MNSKHGSPLKHQTLAVLLLIASLAATSAANASPDAFSEKVRVGHSSETSIDDREDDVMAFFQSGAYRQRLAVPVATAGILVALMSVAGLATKSCRAARPRPYRPTSDS
jgi:hypothetical protein